MNIKITYPGIKLVPGAINTVNGAEIAFHSASDACLALLEEFRDQAKDVLGRPTLERLAIYGRQLGLVVERIDHSVRWKKI